MTQTTYVQKTASNEMHKRKKQQLSSVEWKKSCLCSLISVTLAKEAPNERK